MFGTALPSSAHPDLTKFPQFYDLKTMGSGLSSWYLHFVKSAHDAHPKDWFTVPKGDTLTWDQGSRRQFAVFGGEDSSSGWTLLRKFLDVSGF